MSEVKNEWKEFWIDPLLSPSNSVYTEPSESCIHVIEHSAYQAAQARIEELENKLLTYEGSTFSDYDKERIEELESQNRMLNMKMMNEHSASLKVAKLEQANNILREALEYIREYDLDSIMHNKIYNALTKSEEILGE